MSGIAVVVVNYGSVGLLEQNLVPLSAATGATIVVVDNRSTDLERQRVTELASREGWLLVAPDANEGFGGGMNLGVAEAVRAGADVLVLVNPDARMDAAALERLAQHVRERPMEAVSPTVLRPDGSIWFRGSDLHLVDGRIKSPARRQAGDVVVPWLSGACLALSRSLWERVGGFDDAFFLYWEDVDLSWRILRAGGSLAVLDDVSAVHDEGGTHRDADARAEAKSPVYYYYNIRNRQLFAAKNLDQEAAGRWRRNDVRVAWEILLQGGKRQFSRPVRPLRAAYRGVRDGRRLSSAVRTRGRR